MLLDVVLIIKLGCVCGIIIIGNKFFNCGYFEVGVVVFEVVSVVDCVGFGVRKVYNFSFLFRK